MFPQIQDNVLLVRGLQGVRMPVSVSFVQAALTSPPRLPAASLSSLMRGQHGGPGEVYVCVSLSLCRVGMPMI